jgi:hypothetical protein
MRKPYDPTPFEEVYGYWLGCRIFGLGKRKGSEKFHLAYGGLKRLYARIALRTDFRERTMDEMVQDIENLAVRLRKTVSESEQEGEFEL